MNKHYCTNCGSEMDPNAEFCVKCGVIKGKTKHFCGNCGSPVNEEQDFCISCGNKLSSLKNSSAKIMGTKSLQKVTQSAVKHTNDLVDLASKKTGKKIKPAWIVGGVSLLVIIGIAIFLLIPKGISGTYTHVSKFLGTESKSTLTFKGNTYKEDGNSNHGTYKISGETITFTMDNTNKDVITGSISKDKKSVTILGMTFNKNEKK